MIKELAHFEESDDHVKATEESLGSTILFADEDSSTTSKPGYLPRTLILTSPEGHIAGMALYFHNYSTWRSAPGIYLEDLFVRPEYRRKGYATLLIRELARMVKKIGGARLEWACLRWNENALATYRALGAKEQSEWVGLRVDGEELEKLCAREINGA